VVPVSLPPEKFAWPASCLSYTLPSQLVWLDNAGHPDTLQAASLAHG